jgi:hypothetical protein
LEPILSELTNDFGSAFGGISFEVTNSEYDSIMVWMDIRISRWPVAFLIWFGIVSNIMYGGTTAVIVAGPSAESATAIFSVQ